MDRRRRLIKGVGVSAAWVTPIIQTVVLPVHAQTSATTTPAPGTTTTPAPGTTTTPAPGTTTTPAPGTTTTPAPGTTTTTTTTTPEPACSRLEIELRWEVDRYSPCLDLDLEVLTPGGSYIAPKSANGTNMGQCLEHSGDYANVPDRTGRYCAYPGQETIGCKNSVVAPGHYSVYVRVPTGFNGIDHLLGDDDLSSLRIAVTGCGNAININSDVTILTPGVNLITEFDVPA